MSINKLKSVFENVDTCDAWSLQLLQIKNSKRKGTTYCGREITLSPDGTLTNFIEEISKKYRSSEKGLEKMFECVTDYDGSTIEKTVYKLNAENELISSEYHALIEAIANPDSEVDPLEFSAQAYILKGVIVVAENELSVKMISMQNPVTSLKHKFWHSNGTFKEISDKVISLRTAIDVVIVDNTVYMLTLAGENLFNMERAYKSVCEKQINNIADLCIRHNHFSVNVWLEILNYKMFTCELENEDNTIVQRKIISQRTLNSHKGEYVYLKSLNNEIKLDIEK